MFTDNEIDEFIRTTKKTPSGCLEWQGGKFVRGYGRSRMNGHQCTASRVSYTMFVGPIPEGLHILHGCDNPPCVNPTHLRPGTSKENMQEREKRGRRKAAKGSGHGMSKLNEDKVREIRSLYAAGGTSYSKLGEQFGVDFTMIALIVKRKNWKHVQ